MPSLITVEQVEDFPKAKFQVTVNSGGVTKHSVTVNQADYNRLAGDRSVEDLVRDSLAFLLERESNTSILSSFDLMQIKQYFPEYEEVIKNL